jgi:protein-L-isoaspartate O-methyltransferase
LGVDEQVAQQAAANLEAASYNPTLIIGDAVTCIEERAAFDLVHVTCGVTILPYPWVEHARPGRF